MKPMRLMRLILIPMAVVALVGAGVVVGLLVSDHGASDPGGAPETQSADGSGSARPSGEATSDSTAPSHCTIYWQDRGAAIRVTSPDAAADCLSFVEAFGQQGEFWSRKMSCDSFATGENCENANRVDVCVAVLRDIFVTVSDTGGAYRGRQICANLAGKRWDVRPGGPGDI
jgi:hypothetical protein